MQEVGLELCFHIIRLAPFLKMSGFFIGFHVRHCANRIFSFIRSQHTGRRDSVKQLFKHSLSLRLQQVGKHAYAHYQTMASTIFRLAALNYYKS